MVLGPGFVAAVSLAYIAFLFAIAWWAGRRAKAGRSITNNALVYSLSIAVYCTSWTFYGSVGLAANSGMRFLAVYLGPTLVAFSWWFLLRRMVRITRDYHISSIADFVAFRYGNSAHLGALVAIMCLVGITPYIGLQLKAVAHTFDLVAQWGNVDASSIFSKLHKLDTGLIVAITLGLFAGMFGARQLDPSERHEGMIAAIAAESVVKLVALLAVGAYTTWWIFDGFSDIFVRISETTDYAHLLDFSGEGQGGYISWFSLLTLSTGAVMLLPRQFQVMVVEATSEKHVAGAMWMFPVYLFLINLFVLPLALGGLLLFSGNAQADAFVLLIPLETGQPLLALMVYLGGLSAATGMVIVSSVALSTMLLNNLLMPVLLNRRLNLNLSRVLIHLKRLAILLVVAAGYFYYRLFGESLMLVNIGLISFGAAAQLGPALFGGIFWRQATAKGAGAGLLLGFASWGYMFLVPSLCKAGWLPPSWLIDGPMGMGLLRPNAFLGLEGMDVWSHGLFWSMFLNVGGFVTVSLFSGTTRSEMEQVAKLVYSERGAHERRTEYRLAKAPTVEEFENLLAKFMGLKKGRQKMRRFFGGNYSADEQLPDKTLLRLRQYVEKQLGGVVGPAAANAVVERYMSLKGTRMEEIFDVFGEVSISLEQSRDELEDRVRELSLLFAAAKKSVTSLDENEAIEGVLSLLESDFSIHCQGVFFFENMMLKRGPVTGMNQKMIDRITSPAVDNSIILKAALTGQTIQASKAEEEDYVELGGGQALYSLLAVPIKKDEEVLAVLFIASRDREGRYSAQFANTMEALATELFLAITNARLFSEVRDLNVNLEEKVKDRTSELVKALSELKELGRLKSQFLANMSHELRTPLNAILGYTQLIQDGVDGPVTNEQLESLDRVEKNSRNLLHIIDGILDFSKIEAGKLKLDRSEFDLGVLAEGVVRDLSSLARINDLELTTRIGEGDLSIFADFSRIREVMYNLVSNALKFTEEGGVTIRVGVGERKGVEGVTFHVIDTGPGISLADTKVIFEAFKQLDGSITRAHGGTGLGLSIARHLMALHGGTLDVESTLEAGTTFKAWMPRVRQPEAQTVEDAGTIEDTDVEE